MSVEFCTNHICKRIAHSLKAHNFTSLLPFLSLKKTNLSDHVCYEVPIKSVQKAFNVDDVGSILTMKTDSTILRIHTNSDVNNIFFDISKDKFMKTVLKSIPHSICQNPCTKSKNVLVEYSSPNIAKPFHVGHLRSTIVGNYVANILEKSHNVKRLNYLGDWGTQVGFIKAGLEASQVSDVHLKENPMKELYNAYCLANSDPNILNEAREIFSHLEKGASEWQVEWERIRTLTINNLAKTYKSFGITFDEYSFESNYRAENISPVLDLLDKNQLTSFKDGCLVLNYGDKTIPLLKNDGTTLYLVRDIAAALDRLNKYDCDEMVYVVDKSQSAHINNLAYAITQLTKNNIINHVPFGKVIGMSTRKGTSVFLDDILHEIVNKMSQQQLISPNTRTTDPETTKILGVSALMIYILKQRRNRDIHFSWENALQGTGDSGIKLQYTHCRLFSLEKKNNLVLPEDVDPATLKEDIVFELIYELARYREVLQASQEHLESSFLVLYLFRLCNLVSQCLKKLPVKGEHCDLAAQRLLLFNAARQTITSAMKTLGLQPLNEM